LIDIGIQVSAKLRLQRILLKLHLDTAPDDAGFARAVAGCYSITAAPGRAAGTAGPDPRRP
jgi:hypothetical protein